LLLKPCFSSRLLRRDLRPVDDLELWIAVQHRQSRERARDHEIGELNVIGADVKSFHRFAKKIS